MTHDCPTRDLFLPPEGFRWQLASSTVFLYSIPSQEIHMRHGHLRYTYSPSPVYLPCWVR